MYKYLFITVLGLIGIMGVLSLGVVNASDISCWEGKGTPPTTTYASGIVYGCDGEIPIITIYGENGKGITIKAMNEGATAISFSGNDTNSFGNTYQWGNNYPFPSAADTITPITISSTSVSAEGYGPRTPLGYYNSGVWVGSDWDVSDNRNLWGGSGDEKNLNGFWGYDTENFVAINTGDRQAMCPDGYHIPSAGEWNALLYLWGKNYDINQGTSLFTNQSLNNLNSNYLLGGTGTRFSKDMQIPFAGYRNGETTSTTYSNNNGGYRSSSPNKNLYYPDIIAFIACSFNLNPILLQVENIDGDRLMGYSIRCFKNEYVKPITYYTVTFLNDGQWVASGTVEDGDMRSEIVPTPSGREGYHFDYRYADGADNTTGFDFDTPITADTILHAKWTLTATVPNGIYTGLSGGDITVIWNDETRGNISLTLAGNDLDGYYFWGWDEPGNDNWEENPTIGVEHNNDWGGGGGNAENGYDDGNERYKRQGPCPSGYHIPSMKEWNDLVIAWCNVYTGCDPDIDLDHTDGWLSALGLGMEFKQDFGMSKYNFRSSSYSIELGDDYGRGLNVGKNSIHSSNLARYEGYSVHCFKNYVTSPQIFNVAFFSDDENIWSGYVVSGNKISKDVVLGYNLTGLEKEGYTFSGWIVSGTNEKFNVENDTVITGMVLNALRDVDEYAIIFEDGSGIQQDVIYSGNYGAILDVAYPEWSRNGYTINRSDNIPATMPLNGMIITASRIQNLNASYLIEYYFEKVDGIDYELSGDLVENLSGVVGTIAIVQEKFYSGFSFSGSNINNIVTGNITESGDLVLRLYYDRNFYVLKFEVDGSVIESGNVKFGANIVHPFTPIKNGYTFVKWVPDIPATMPSENLTIKATWEKINSSGGGGGGGGGSRKNDSGNTGTQVVNPENETGKNVKIQSGDQQPLSFVEDLLNRENTDYQLLENNSEVRGEGGYSLEFQQAYNFAYKNGITTKSTIQKADMNGKLTRIQMAKMLSQYAINVLGKRPDTSKGVVKFNDVTDKMDKDYNNGVTLAYQLGIMGINMPNNKFRPNDEVTRAEFVTALSRMLYSTPDGNPYYITHLEKLRMEGILTKLNPMMKEIRGYVMIMLMRSVK